MTGMPLYMWAVIPVLIVAGLSFAFGLLPVGIVLVVLVLLAIGGQAVGGLRNRRIERVDAPGGIPSTREAAHEARVDPRRAPTGSTTGTP